MTNTKTDELQVNEKREAAGPAELTKPGPVFTPHVDIFETEKDIALSADMPGVSAENLDIDLRENTLTLTGDIAGENNNNEDRIYVEYKTGRYYRQFSLSGVIDQSKIDARLNDGVLRLLLPKVEKAVPRQISIKTG
ncbi:Hsp20/alpha crystallin family protein [Desulfococcaceae bacterium HSG9]|nr:Hsp20/alpha crystallin family protein [Desulfococcaceae bacterium HSG9]